MLVTERQAPWTSTDTSEMTEAKMLKTIFAALCAAGEIVFPFYVCPEVLLLDSFFLLFQAPDFNSFAIFFKNQVVNSNFCYK